MKTEITLNSNCDKLPLSVAVIAPDKDIKAIVQISHGMSEHKGRYYDFMEYLAANGYAAVINDHRGHGKSVRAPEDLGYFYEEKAEYIVEDLHQVTEYAKNLFPGKDVILFGHSMGSMVARKYIKKYDNDITKLIICGSPSKNPLMDIGVFFNKIVKAVKGSHYRSNIVKDLTFGNYNDVVDDVFSVNSWICANEDNVRKYESDELCGFTFTTNGFQNLFQLMKDIYSDNGWNLNNPNLPILFIAGSDDPVTLGKKRWLLSQSFLRDIGYKNISCKYYKGLRHELLNEKCNKRIYKDILSFISAKYLLADLR